MICKNCGLKINRDLFNRCPRCNTVINIPLKCLECKGCSLFKGDNKSVKNCKLDQKK